MRSACDYGVVAYGSLMHPDELARHCAGMGSVPVRVRGYRRSFSQEPSWRRGAGMERGVLTVRRSSRDWFNAILVCGPDARALASLDHRERGYTRIGVPPTDLEPYANRVAAPAREIFVYTGRDDRWNDRLLPNRDYLRICIEASQRWGPEFADDFLRSTHVGREALYAFMHD